jgi:predicted GH43/DUF377 family glycosyl hydrolase
MKSKLLVMLLLTGCFLLMNMLSSLAQIENWNDVVDHAVFSYGNTGEWDDGHVWNPAVIKDGDTLRMYYTGGNEIVWESPNTNIGYAWSLDGIEWTRYHSNPVLVPFPENWYLFGCAVIMDVDMYKMWYGRAANPGSPAIRIGYATSEDGMNWTKQESSVLAAENSNEWDESIITPQTVIKEGDEYKMWYWAGMTGFPFEASMPQIGLATSPDGINWTKYDDPTTTESPYEFSDPVLKVGADGSWDEYRAISPMVLKKGSGYEMFYAGSSWNNTGLGHPVGYAQSNDGIHWTKHSDPVILDPRSWGNTNYGGTVLAFDNYYHLWYACFNPHGHDGAPAIGYAWSHTAGIEMQKMEISVQLYPNPFTSSTILSYSLKQPSTVQLSVFNQMGQLVYQRSEEQQQGEQRLQWDAQDIAEGIYYYGLKAGDQIAKGKLVKVK